MPEGPASSVRTDRRCWKLGNGSGARIEGRRRRRRHEAIVDRLTERCSRPANLGMAQVACLHWGTIRLSSKSPLKGCTMMSAFKRAALMFADVCGLVPLLVRAASAQELFLELATAVVYICYSPTAGHPAGHSKAKNNKRMALSK